MREREAACALQRERGSMRPPGHTQQPSQHMTGLNLLRTVAVAHSRRQRGPSHVHRGRNDCLPCYPREPQAPRRAMTQRDAGEVAAAFARGKYLGYGLL